VKSKPSKQVLSSSEDEKSQEEDEDEDFYKSDKETIAKKQDVSSVVA
jgi:hypothetical protein